MLKFFSIEDSVIILNVDFKDVGIFVYVSVVKVLGIVVLYDFLK